MEGRNVLEPFSNHVRLESSSVLVQSQSLAVLSSSNLGEVLPCCRVRMSWGSAAILKGKLGYFDIEEPDALPAISSSEQGLVPALCPKPLVLQRRARSSCARRRRL